MHDLNPSESGGAEIINLDKRTNSGSAPESSIDLTDLSTSANPPSSADPELPLSHASAGATKNAATKSFLPKGHGRIFRDDAGNVVRVELPDEEIEIEDLPGNRDIDMEQLEPQLDENTRQTWISDLGGLKTRLSTNRNTTVVKGMCSICLVFISQSFLVLSCQLSKRIYLLLFNLYHFSLSNKVHPLRTYFSQSERCSQAFPTLLDGHPLVFHSWDDTMLGFSIRRLILYLFVVIALVAPSVKTASKDDTACSGSSFSLRTGSTVSRGLGWNQITSLIC